MGLSAIWGFLKSIPAAIALVRELLSLVQQIRRAFNEDPVKKYADAEQAQKEADKAAEDHDDTSGVFGGSK